MMSAKSVGCRRKFRNHIFLQVFKITVANLQMMSKADIGRRQSNVCQKRAGRRQQARLRLPRELPARDNICGYKRVRPRFQCGMTSARGAERRSTAYDDF